MIGKHNVTDIVWWKGVIDGNNNVTDIVSGRVQVKGMERESKRKGYSMVEAIVGNRQRFTTKE